MAQMNNILRYFACYFHGHGYMGEVSELKLPSPKVKREEFRGGGMDMPIEVDLGMEKLEFEFKLFSQDALPMERFGLLGDTARTSMTIRGYLEGQTGAKSSIKINMDVRAMEIEYDTWKPASKTEVTVKGAVDFYECFHDERRVCLFDPLGFKRVINGVDQLTDARVALGLMAGAN